MSWGVAGVILIVTGYVCRRLLHLDRPVPGSRVLLPLSSSRAEIYQPIALEIETQTTILGISLNDALCERAGGNLDKAWSLAGLAGCQWERLAENVVTLLKAITENMPLTRSLVTVRNIAPNRFKSREMLELARKWSLVEQMVFRSKLRYQLHVHVLRRAAEMLTADFRQSCGARRKSVGSSLEAWKHLDPVFHDFDLVVKESLLCFRALLISLPDPALQSVAAELRGVLVYSVRSCAIAAPNHVRL